MAMVTFGPLVTEARGKVGDVVFTRNRGGAVAKAFAKPTFFRSHAQQAWKPNYPIVSAVWSANLTDAQRTAWGYFAAQHPKIGGKIVKRSISGWQMFMKLNLALHGHTGGYLLSPPPDLSTNESTTVSITTNSASPANLTITLANPNGLASTDAVQIKATYPLRAGYTNFHHGLSQVAWLTALGPTNITAAWTATMAALRIPRGPLTTGTRIGIMARTFNTLTGYYAVAQFATSITSAVGPGPYLPTYVPGLAAWFDAAQIAGATNANPIATWPDMSGAGRNATQATGTKQPVYYTNLLNSLPGVTFNGTSDWMQTTNWGLAQPATILMVGKCTYSSGNIYALDGIGALVAALRYTSNTLFGETAGGSASSASIANAANPLVGGCVFNPGAATLTVNGIATTATVGIAAPAGITLGAEGNTLAFLPGTLFEILVFSTALSTANRQIMEGYLAWKWGLNALLPISHPWYGAPPTA